MQVYSFTENTALILHPYFLVKKRKQKEIYFYTLLRHITPRISAAANRIPPPSYVFLYSDILTPVHVLDAT